jgi:hypothetical protein
MRKLMLVALLAVPYGCAHHEPRNLAQRQSTKTPRGDFDGARRQAPRDRAVNRAEPSDVTPLVP